jgi:hypothetical protein
MTGSLIERNPDILMKSDIHIFCFSTHTCTYQCHDITEILLKVALNTISLTYPNLEARSSVDKSVNSWHSQWMLPENANRQNK